MRCSQCHRVLKQSPPKHTISNLITIGTLPKSMSATLTEVTGPLLSQKKTSANVVSYSGGAYKEISGSFAFSTRMWNRVLVFLISILM